VLRLLLPGDPQAAPVAVSEPSAASMIVTQTPAPGQKITAGSAVNFEVR
jgi:beta-lactam-binding protein with PASTA domain